MRMLTFASMAALGLTIGASLAHGEDQATVMRQKLREPGNLAKIPTGYEVSGPTFVQFDAWHGYRRTSPTDTAHPKLFWKQHDGAGAGGPGSDGGGGGGQ